MGPKKKRTHSRPATLSPDSCGKSLRLLFLKVKVAWMAVAGGSYGYRLPWHFFSLYLKQLVSASSGGPVDQTCGIQQCCCLIEEVLDVESDFKPLVMKARTGVGIGCAIYSRSLVKPVTNFS